MRDAKAPPFDLRRANPRVLTAFADVAPLGVRAVPVYIPATVGLRAFRVVVPAKVERGGTHRGAKSVVAGFMGSALTML
ncbi:MAG: hypothetical protein OEQ49_13805 [Myxococcales bacterium]|nr:hypothetical protein [Myxococcales bacterium]